MKSRSLCWFTGGNGRQIRDDGWPVFLSVYYWASGARDYILKRLAYLHTSYIDSTCPHKNGDWLDKKKIVGVTNKCQWLTDSPKHVHFFGCSIHGWVQIEYHVSMSKPM